VSPDEQNLHFERWLGAHAAMLHHVAHGFAEGEDRHDLMQELLLRGVARGAGFSRGIAALDVYLPRGTQRGAQLAARAKKLRAADRAVWGDDGGRA